MPQMLRVVLMLSFVLGFNSISIVKADEVDDMVQVLNKELSNNNSEGFAKAVTEYFERDKRYHSTDFAGIGKSGASVLTTMATFGDYVRHDIIKKSECGEKIKRVVSVFFLSQGQYVIDYWFFKVKDEWSLTSFDTKGEGRTGDFIRKLSEVTNKSCD